MTAASEAPEPQASARDIQNTPEAMAAFEAACNDNPSAVAIAAPAGTEVSEYSKTEAGLASLRSRLANVVYDVATTAGMASARADRRECVTLRTDLDRLRLQKNADDQARIKGRNRSAQALTEEIVKLETPIDEAIKAEEKRKEDERVRRADAEALRVKGIRDRIAALMRKPADAIGLDAAGVRVMRAELEAARMDATWGDSFAEFAGEARGAREAGIEFLVDLEAKKSAAETSAAEAAAIAQKQAEESERQRAEQRRLDDERAAVVAREQAVIDEEKRQAAERDRLAAEEAAATRKRAEDEAAAERKREEDETRRKAEEAASERQREADRILAERKEADHEQALVDDVEWTAQQKAAAERAAEHKRIAVKQAHLGRMVVRKQIREKCPTALDALRAIFELCNCELVSDGAFRSQACALSEAFVIEDGPCPNS